MKSSILLILFVIVKCDEYLELLKSTVGVRILPLRIDINSTELVGHPVCRLTVHKNTCTGPSISFNDTISWSTKVCFQWRCNALDHAMKISNCWIGTTKNPVYLIRSNGCTTESALLRTPSYLSFQRAISIGWLTVREVGMKNIYIQCDITLCHFCDPYCQESTPPRKCSEVSNQTVENYDRMWNSSKAVDKLCNPVIELEPTSTSYLSNSSTISITCKPLNETFKTYDPRKNICLILDNTRRKYE
ncbi:unnamed protein product [Auanema sp. JU1783]|nr:unnamed protein product [Auanema sp. JU1783]